MSAKYYGQVFQLILESQQQGFSTISPNVLHVIKLALEKAKDEVAAEREEAERNLE